MINFDADTIIRNYQYIYDRRKTIEEIADEICDAGFDLLFFTSSGGSMAMMEPFCHYLNVYSRIPCAAMVSADFLLTGCNRLTERSVAFMTSKSGDTRETLECARKLKEMGIRIVSVLGREDTPLGSLSDYSFVYNDGRPQELVFWFIIGKIMYNRGAFPQYPDFADNLSELGKALVQVRIDCDEKCCRYAEAYGREPYNIWIGSGDLWPTAYSYSMCVLEESLWIPTKSVTSAEFFHGTLELVDRDVCVTLLLGEGVTRSQDERVREFVRGLTDKLTCFDTRDYELPGIRDEYRKYLSPIVMAAILQRIGKNAEVILDHPLETRRYYRKSEY
ncbi:MAG: SIS domain-containing protein [Erysipelotrichaceae bacterium]|nr:SIS domain-containing protein [Erysipelotrichaceae bacterium]MBR5049569.1 SIS domain-containing protein [Erysipelotrichaceae bacterium]